MVERVDYPELSTHPDHALAQRQLAGGGVVVTFRLNGNRKTADRFIESIAGAKARKRG